MGTSSAPRRGVQPRRGDRQQFVGWAYSPTPHTRRRADFGLRSRSVAGPRHDRMGEYARPTTISPSETRCESIAGRPAAVFEHRPRLHGTVVVFRFLPIGSRGAILQCPNLRKANHLPSLFTQARNRPPHSLLVRIGSHPNIHVRAAKLCIVVRPRFGLCLEIDSEDDSHRRHVPEFARLAYPPTPYRCLQSGLELDPRPAFRDRPATRSRGRVHSPYRLRALALNRQTEPLRQLA